MAGWLALAARLERAGQPEAAKVIRGAVHQLARAAIGQRALVRDGLWADVAPESSR